MIPDVIVIGGGLAGLSASVKLVKAGASILLIEKNNHLGGRTYSFVEKNTKSVVDNGQHLLVGAYKNTFKYLEIIGTSELLSKQELNGFIFLENGKKCEEIVIPQVPKPLNLFIAIFKMRALSISEKIDLLKLGLAIKNWDQNFQFLIKNTTVKNWLDFYEQNDRTRKYFWYPLTISIMNESPDVASAYLFANAIKRTYFDEGESSKIWIPAVGQSELYVEQAVKLIESSKSKIILNKKVNKIITKDRKYVGIEAGEVLKSKYAICAVPHLNFLNILKDSYLYDKYSHIGDFNLSPIVSVNIWFDRDVMEYEFVGLIGTTVQWVFNRSKILSYVNKKQFYIAAVISNAREILNLSREQILNIVLNDLKKNFPKMNDAKILFYKVIKERAATFSATPEVETFRPEQESKIKNLYIAGDWTKTDLPATIEGAVYSGFKCADLILKNT